MERPPACILAARQDAATAKRLAFSREVASRCITLDGDDFNPSGTLTGGSRAKGGDVLTKVQALCEAEATLQKHCAALDAAQAELKVRLLCVTRMDCEQPCCIFAH